MINVLISKEQAKQFAYECFDVIIRDIRVNEEKVQEDNYINDSPRKIA